MLTILFFAKLSAVLTVVYAGMNVHQLTSSYAYQSAKIVQFRALFAESGSTAGLVRMNLIFYVALPGTYLSLLRLSAVEARVLGIMAVKFACTAAMDIRAERRIIAGGEYTPAQHAASRLDNLVNLACAAGVIYVLLKPVLPGR
jgi:hypothetical protein